MEKYDIESTMNGFFARRYFEIYHTKNNLEVTSTTHNEEELVRTILLPFLLLDISYNDFSLIDRTRYKQKSKQYLNKVTVHTASFWKDFWRDYCDNSKEEKHILSLMDGLEEELKLNYKLLNIAVMKNFKEIQDMEIKKDIAKIEVYVIFIQIANRMFTKVLGKPINMLSQLEREAAVLGNCIYSKYSDNLVDIFLNRDKDVVAFVRQIIDKVMRFITVKK